MADEEKNEKPKIRVTDRRVSRQGEEETTLEEPTQTKTVPQESDARQVHSQNTENPGEDQYPPIDFNTFLLSLSTSALVNMGAIADPNTGQSNPNLPLAKQTIDLIGLIEEKTTGNLNGEEERLMSQILYDLRMRYINVSKETSS